MYGLIIEKKQMSILVLLGTILGLALLAPQASAFELVSDEAITSTGVPVTVNVLANDTFTLDVVISSDGSENQICVLNKYDAYECRNISADTKNSQQVILGDLNGDGYLDVVVANKNQENKACLGQGDGTFGECTNIGSDIMDSRGIALGDVNGDGNLDVVVANYAENNKVCLGNGDGTFGSCNNVSGDAFNSNRVVLGKVNLDEHLDALFANSNDHDSRICLGNGDGTFGCSDVGVISTDYWSKDAALGDLNKDGKLDAVFAIAYNGSKSTFKNVSCLGDGLGGFTCTAKQHPTLTNQADDACGVDLGDLDGDNNLDAAFALDSGFYVMYWLGDGLGDFSLHNTYTSSASYRDVTLVSDNNGVMYYLLAHDYMTQSCTASPGPSGCRTIYSGSNITSAAADYLIKKVIVSEPPTHGTAVVNSDRTITYTPNPEFVGEDVFFYSMGNWSAAVKVKVGSPASVAMTFIGGGIGRVTSDPDGLDCYSNCEGLFNPGNQVTFSPWPGDGSAFDGWSIESCPGNGDCTLTLDQPAYAITAFFRTDTDNDGISDETEQSGPYRGDGNQDGLPDYQQTGVTTFKDIEGHWVTLVAEGGLILTDVRFLENIAPSPPPAGNLYPFGFIKFKVQGGAAGAKAVVTMIIHQIDTNLTSYDKYGPTPKDPSDHWYDFVNDGSTGALVEAGNGQMVIALNFQDGWTGDDDLTVDGSISAYGGPYTSIETASSPGNGGGGCFISDLNQEVDHRD